MAILPDPENAAARRPTERRGGGLGGGKKQQRNKLGDITNQGAGRAAKRRKKGKKATAAPGLESEDATHTIMTRSRSKPSDVPGKGQRRVEILFNGSWELALVEKETKCAVHVRYVDGGKEQIPKPDISTRLREVAKPEAGPEIHPASGADPTSQQAECVDLTCAEVAEIPTAAPAHVDIDQIHRDDPKFASQYIDDIYEYHREAEVLFRPDPIDYMTSVQDDISDRMRSILVDWLIEVADEYKLEQKTLHLSVSTIDRVLAKRKVSRGKLQLVGCACMLLAGKYEEIYPPTVEDYSYISDNTYTPQQVLDEERRVLVDIDYTLTLPTVHTFLERFLDAAQANKEQMFLAQYFVEIMLLHIEFLRFKPSLCAATAVFYMRIIMPAGGQLWDVTLRHYTRLEEAAMRPCCKLLHTKHINSEVDELKAVYEKFSGEDFQEVAGISPPPSLPF